jgi:hypothetical protein
MAQSKPTTNGKAPIMKKGHTSTGHYGDTPNPKHPVTSTVKEHSLK